MHYSRCKKYIYLCIKSKSKPNTYNKVCYDPKSNLVQLVNLCNDTDYVNKAGPN